MALLARLAPKQIFGILSPQLYPFFHSVSGSHRLGLARDRSTKHNSHRARRLIYGFGMFLDVVSQPVHDECVNNFRLIVRHRIFEMTVKLQRVAALASACVIRSSHVGASRSGTYRLGRHRRIMWIGSLHRCFKHTGLSVLPRSALVCRRTMAVLALHLYRL